MADHFDRDLRHRCRNPLFVRTVPRLRACLLRSVVGRLLVFLIYEQSSIRQRSFSLLNRRPRQAAPTGTTFCTAQLDREETWRPLRINEWPDCRFASTCNRRETVCKLLNAHQARDGLVHTGHARSVDGDAEEVHRRERCDLPLLSSYCIFARSTLTGSSSS